MSGEKILQDWLQSISLTEFFQKYWDKQLLHISRNTKNHYDNIISLEQIENWFQSNNLYYPTVEMRGKNTNHEDWSQATTLYKRSSGNLINKQNLIKELHKGHPLQVNSFSQFVPSFYNVIKSLNIYFLGTVIDYLIISPPNKPSFTTHYDREHVIVLQLGGTKDWYFTNRPSKTTTGKSVLYNMLLAPPTVVRMQPGDFLYLPNGLYHKTKTIGDENSISISIAVQLIKGKDIIDEAVRQAEVAFSNINGMIPFPFTEEATKSQYFETLKKDFIEYIQQLSFDDIFENVVDNKLEPYTQQLKITEVPTETTITAETQLQLAKGIKASYVKSENIIRVKFNQHILIYLSLHELGIKYILNQPTFTPKSIPLMLDMNTKIEFVQNLVHKGFLSIVQKE